MPLILKPTIKDFSRAELEEHIQGIRTRRMVIAFDHAAAERAKMESGTSKIEKKFGEHAAMLGRELEGLDRALAKVEKRLDGLTQMKQEHELISDLLGRQEIVSEG